MLRTSSVWAASQDSSRFGKPWMLDFGPFKTAIQLPGLGDSRKFPFGYNTCMDFFFPEDDLQRMAPEETHITSLSAEAYPDGERVRVNIEMTPFQKRPYIEVALTDATSEEVATASIV